MIEVRLTEHAKEEASALPRTIQVRVLAVIDRLQHWPQVSGAKPLRGNLAGHSRVRTGDYRVQFFIRGGVLWIEKIGHRDGFYEE